MQVGDRETYDRPGNSPDIDSEYAISDRSGYLDLLADHHLEPGIHKVSYRVNGRKPVTSHLYTIPSSAKVGVISDVDDTVMITQAPVLWKAAWNLLFLNPFKRSSVPGMSVLFNKIADLFPDAPFFYLSTSPGMWKVRFAISSPTMDSPKARCCCAISIPGPKASSPPDPSTNSSSPNSSCPIFRI